MQQTSTPKYTLASILYLADMTGVITALAILAIRKKLSWIA